MEGVASGVKGTPTWTRIRTNLTCTKWETSLLHTSFQSESTGAGLVGLTIFQHEVHPQNRKG